jgi:hypothetical protein
MAEPLQIHLARKSVQLGVFAPEEVIAGLASGRFQPTDLAWTNGMTAWKPVGQWPEFAVATAGVPASPESAESAPAAASLIPWEQGKSLGSFFATLKAVLFSPRETLATGRFAFGDWLAFCYVALLLVLPFQLIALFAFGSKNQQVADLLTKFGAAEAAEKILASPEPPPVFAAFLMIVSVGLAPMSYAMTGLFQWLGMKLFRMSAPLERTVAATLLASATLLLLAAPLHFLGFNLFLQIGVAVLVGVPLSIVYYRAIGAATGTSPWAQFGITCLLGFILCCCCCTLPVMLFGGIGALAAAR